MSAFDPTKPVQTSDRRSARILATDIAGSKPIAAAYSYGNGECVGQFYADGRFRAGGVSPLDLVNIPVKRRGWINIYPNLRLPTERYYNRIWESRDIADSSAFDERVACIEIEWEE